MIEAAQFSGVVENIYDASIDAAAWSEALEKICRYVGGCSANLFYQDIVKHEVVQFNSWGDDPYYRELYFKSYVALNPLFPVSSFLEVGKAHLLSEVMPIEEFKASRFYREWVQPQGILDATYVNLERTASGGAALAVRRWERDGLFDAAAKARFQLLVPHIRRAIAIGKLVEFHRASAQTLSATLDCISAAAILVAADGRPVFLNAAAETLLVAGSVLKASSGRLAAVDGKADADLREAIAAATRGDGALGDKGVAITLSHDREPLVAHVLSLASGTRRERRDFKAVAAVFVRRATLQAPQPIEIMTRLYKLTAGEVRVLALLAQTDGVARIAAALGVSESTVKTHLQHLFAKTGTRRQAELIGLLARHISPVRG